MKSLFKLAQSVGHASSKTKPKEVTYTIFGKDGKYPSAVFCIGADIRKQMRWIKGDRVDVLYDPEMAEGQIIRLHEGGWQLSDIGKDSSPARVRISLKPEFKLPQVEGKVDLAVQLTDNTITFAFPTKYRQLVLVAEKGKK